MRNSDSDVQQRECNEHNQRTESRRKVFKNIGGHDEDSEPTLSWNSNHKSSACSFARKNSILRKLEEGDNENLLGEDANESEGMNEEGEGMSIDEDSPAIKIEFEIDAEDP